MHDKQSMSAIARHELKIDTIKAEMSKYEKSHHIGNGFAQLALGTLLIGFPLINVVLIAGGLKNIFFKSYANKMEKDYYKEKHTEVSEYLGVSYRHLLHVLAQFCKENLIKKHERGYIILDKERLQQLAAIK